MALRWSKQPRETGLRAVCQGVRGYDLKKDGAEVAHVRPLCRGFNRYDVIGWYWYGFGTNTSSTPVATADEAKVWCSLAYKSAHA